MWLFFLFVAVPILEIALFIQVGGAIGLWPTLGIVILTAIAGTYLVRTQGLQALQRLQTALERGQDPAIPLVHGAMILVAGVLLLTPGFFTDAVGLSFLIPPIRAAIIRFAGRHVVARGVSFRMQGQHRPGPQSPPRNPDTVDADYTVLDEDADRPGRDDTDHRGGSGWTRP